MAEGGIGKGVADGAAHDAEAGNVGDQIGVNGEQKRDVRESTCGDKPGLSCGVSSHGVVHCGDGADVGDWRG